MARVVSRRAMREFNLKFTEDGRVVEGDPRSLIDPGPELTFTLKIAKQPVQIEYTQHYFPGNDSFSVQRRKQPAQRDGIPEACSRRMTPSKPSADRKRSPRCTPRRN